MEAGKAEGRWASCWGPRLWGQWQELLDSGAVAVADMRLGCRWRRRQSGGGAWQPVPTRWATGAGCRWVRQGRCRWASGVYNRGNEHWPKVWVGGPHAPVKLDLGKYRTVVVGVCRSTFLHFLFRTCPTLYVD